MKRVVAIIIAIFLLTGCSEELKESKKETKNVEDKIENVIKKQDKKEIVVPVQPQPQPLTKDELSYIDVVDESIGTYGQNVNNVSRLINDAKQDSSVVATKEWVNQIEGNFMVINALSEMFKDMTKTNHVPDKFTDLHKYTQNTFELMSMSIMFMVKAINSGDKSMMTKSEDFMTQSNLELNNVNAEIDRLTVDFSKK